MRFLSHRIRISTSAMTVGEIKTAVAVYKDLLLSVDFHLSLTGKDIRKTKVHHYRRILRQSLPTIYC